MRQSTGNLQQFRDEKNYEPRNKNREVKGKSFDYSLLFIILFLVCFGLIMVYSSSAYSAQLKFNGDSWYYLRRQSLWAGVGIVGMLIVSFIDYHIWHRFAFLGYIMAIVFLILVLIFGEDINGSKRWLSLGPLGGFQPSEFAKLAIILFMSVIVTKGSKGLSKYGTFLKYIILFLPIILLIANENLSTAIVVGVIPIAILFVASPKYWHFFTLIIPAVVFGGVFLLFFAYRIDRIKVWLNPWDYALGIGFQTIQSLYAIGSGGLFGNGLGQSLQKLGFIPEAHNDIIFSIVCEELGLFGAASLILLFLFLLWRCMIIANSTKDLFGTLLVVGVMTQIAIQVIINIAVVTNSMPPTGIPLPFISYGGSSLSILLVEMGIVLNVSRHIKTQKM